MPTWTFMRHGESEANLEGWYAGQYDSPLTARGRQQAIATRESLPRPLPPRAFCSDLSRAHETATLLLDGETIPLVVTPRLRERNVGAWERRTRDQLLALPEFGPRMQTWSGRPPRGESLLDVAQRVAAWASSVDDASQDTLVIAHGALILAALAAIDGVPRHEVGAHRPRNCEVVSRTMIEGQWASVLEALRDEAAANRPG